MAESIEIKCINKTNRTNPHERIQYIGGVKPNKTRWRLTVAEAIAGIEAGKWAFWTSVGGKVAKVVIAKHEGHKYLKTEADGVSQNNLLSLPECPQ